VSFVFGLFLFFRPRLIDLEIGTDPQQQDIHPAKKEGNHHHWQGPTNILDPSTTI